MGASGGGREHEHSEIKTWKVNRNHYMDKRID